MMHIVVGFEAFIIKESFLVSPWILFFIEKLLKLFFPAVLPFWLYISIWSFPVATANQKAGIFDKIIKKIEGLFVTLIFFLSFVFVCLWMVWVLICESKSWMISYFIHLFIFKVLLSLKKFIYDTLYYFKKAIDGMAMWIHTTHQRII